ncbi:protein kinase domain-containing protein [Streptomyces niger]|uniref:serine/threonine-protein kinase n=1 Tax=Streptomyces niger TaxID=66373 RepID=UPI00069C1DF6|nr:serine/threonine-protein kinase [Streptomyces niger]
MPSPLTHDDPARLGSYTLVARLGGGGMGTVYLGRSPGGRTVALKTMHAALADETEFRTRFRLEVDAARVIGGQYGAQVVDADPLATTPWLATEYVLGPPLDDAVALCGPLPDDAVRALGGALCTALAQLHRSDVVHRDLKPSNILLTATGPKVIDFGIARAAGDVRLTRTGATAGTPAFMSPEQATAQEHTPAGDVFALAGVLVFAATGRPPFGNGQAADMLYRVRYAEPDLTAVPATLQSVLERCLAKDPAERPGAEELGRLLDEGNGDGGAHFADRLPAAVLADIAQRSAAVWEIRPRRLPAPADGGAETAAAVSPARSGLLSRRRLIGAGAGVLAAGTAGGIALFRAGESGPSGGAQQSAGRRPGTPPKLSWKVTAGFMAIDASPIGVGDYVAITTDEGLRCVDARTGEERGSNNSVYSNTVARDGKRLLALDSAEAQLAPLDPETGSFGDPIARIKDHPESARITAVGKDVVLIECPRDKDALRIAYDKHSGRVLWRRTVSGASQRTVFADDRHVVVMAGARIGLVDVRDGRPVWKRTLSGGEANADAGRPVLSGKHLYLSGQVLQAVRLSDGKTDWSRGRKSKAPASTSLVELREYGTPALQGDTLYCARRDVGMVALDAATGEQRWKQEKGNGPLPTRDAEIAVGKTYLYAKPDSGQWAMAVDLHTHRTAWYFQGPNATDGSTTWMTALPRAGRLLMSTDSTVCAIPLE